MHRRSYAREQDVLDLWHYLPLLKERPGALDHAKPFKQWPRPEAFDRYLEVLRRRLPPRTATLRFLEVLELARSRSLTEMAAALDRALATGSLALDTVEYFLRDAAAARHPAVPVLTSAPSCPEVQPRDLIQYSLLVRR